MITIEKTSNEIKNLLLKHHLELDPTKPFHVQDHDISALAHQILAPSPSPIGGDNSPRSILSFPGGGAVICWTRTKTCGDWVLGKGANKKVKVGTFVARHATDVVVRLVAIEIQKNDDKTALQDREKERYRQDYKTRIKLQENPQLAPLIVNVYANHISDKKVKTVVELGKRSLGYLVKEGRSIDRATDCMQQMLHIVSILHQEGFVHCDLKPDNFLEMHDGKVKLIDLDYLEPIDVELQQFKGTPYYLAPEIYLTTGLKQKLKCSPQIDAWSLGCSLFEIFEQKKFLQVLARSTRITLTALNDARAMMYHPDLQSHIDHLLETASAIPEKYRRVIHSLLQIRPEERSSVASAYLQLMLS